MHDMLVLRQEYSSDESDRLHNDKTDGPVAERLPVRGRIYYSSKLLKKWKRINRNKNILYINLRDAVK
jgi:hypothetical protein